jgi:hypothetical protein
MENGIGKGKLKWNTPLYPARDYLTVDKRMSEPGFTGFKDLQD